MEVLPTPGGPTRHKILPYRISTHQQVNQRLLGCVNIRLAKLSRKAMSQHHVAIDASLDSISCGCLQ